jgi:hypothetical protein
MTDDASLLSRLFDVVTGRTCLMEQSTPVLMITVSAFALVLLMTFSAIVDRRRAIAQVPDGVMRGAAVARFILYTGASIILFLVYGLMLSAACR